MFTISDIPNYEEDINRLMKTDQIDFEKAIYDILKSLFNLNIPEEVLLILKIVMWGGLICFVGWILYKEFGSFKHTPSVENTDTITFSHNDMGSAEDADIRGHHLVQELQKAIAEGDFALAVHLRYLMTLQRLDDNNLIRWQPNKTPMMYVRELAVGADKLNEMTMAFLYIKYGHYPANQEVFDEVTQLYNELCAMKEGGEQ